MANNYHTLFVQLLEPYFQLQILYAHCRYRYTGNLFWFLYKKQKDIPDKEKGGPCDK